MRLSGKARRRCGKADGLPATGRRLEGSSQHVVRSLDDRTTGKIAGRLQNGPRVHPPIREGPVELCCQVLAVDSPKSAISPDDGDGFQCVITPKALPRTAQGRAAHPGNRAPRRSNPNGGCISPTHNAPSEIMLHLIPKVGVLQEGPAILRRKNKVQVNLRERLRHGDAP